MKKIALWKKITFLIVLCIAIIRIGYIMFQDEITTNYYAEHIDISKAKTQKCNKLTQKFKSNNSRIDSLELIFSDISKDKQGMIVLSIKDKSDLIYKTNIQLASINDNEWKKIHVNIPVEAKKEYVIEMDSVNCKKKPNVLVTKGKNVSKEAVKSYSKKDEIKGQIAIRFGYQSKPLMIDKCINVAICIAYVLLIGVILLIYDRVKKELCKCIERIRSITNNDLAFVVLEVTFLAYLDIYCDLEIEYLTLIIMGLISLLAGWTVSKTTLYVKSLVDNRCKKMLLAFVYLYCAFALVGQRTFIYPLDMSVSLIGWINYIIAILWCIPIVNGIIYMANKMYNLTGMSKERLILKTWKLVIIMGVLLIVPTIFNLAANNPGISSPDTEVCLTTNIRNFRGMYDWHPAFYCMILKLLSCIWDTTYMIIIWQYVFWLYVMLEGLLYLRKKNVRDEILICIALISGLNPANMIHLNTIWKDIPYTLSVLWLTIIISKLSIDFDEYKKKWYVYIELVIALLGMCLYRKNGIVPFIIVLIGLGIVLRKNTKLLVSLAISVVLVGVYKGPVYDYFDFEEPGLKGMYIGLGQDILGVYYNGGEVSKDTVKMINAMTFENNAEYIYNPTWAEQSTDVYVKPGKFIMNYIDTFVHNPVIMTRAIIAREDAIWDIYQGSNAALYAVHYTGTMDGVGDWNEYYPARINTSIEQPMLEFTYNSVQTQWLNLIIWRCGVISLLTLVVICYGLLKGKIEKYYLILISGFGNILGLLLSTGWSDFRYFWPLNLVNIYVIIVVIIMNKKECLVKSKHGKMVKKANKCEK